jgi:hypothetical protein
MHATVPKGDALLLFGAYNYISTPPLQANAVLICKAYKQRKSVSAGRLWRGRKQCNAGNIRETLHTARTKGSTVDVEGRHCRH